MSGTLSKFTPRVQSHDLLERLFVGDDRVRELDAIIERAEIAATSKTRNHTLLVGPRGAGKSHIVALAYHRLGERISAGTALQRAWLSEDPWRIASYRDLLREIAEALEPEPADVGRAVDVLEAQITESAAERGPVVVFVENLDQVLANIEVAGQQQLRRFLHDERSLLLVATTTELARTLTDQDSAFYNYFTTSRLEPFAVPVATQMLAAIAAEHADTEVAEFLATDVGEARVRTVAHLAGGQPRMWATLGDSLTIEQLDELVSTLMTRFDDLTPYYQEQLARLSPQKRKIVAWISESDRPLNVKEIATHVEVSEQSAAKSVSELVGAGWLALCDSPLMQLLDRRRRYYDLAEPLARVVFQLKDSRGEPVATIVDFLKLWFDPGSLQLPADQLPFSGLTRRYVKAATESIEADEEAAVVRELRGLDAPPEPPRTGLLKRLDAALESLEAGNPALLMGLHSSVRRAAEELLVDLRRDSIQLLRLRVHQFARARFHGAPSPDMATWLEMASRLASSGGSGSALRYLNLLDWQIENWMFDDAEQILDDLSDRRDIDPHQILTRQNRLAVKYLDAGKVAQAVDLHELVLLKTIEAFGDDSPNTLTSRNNLALAYQRTNRTPDAVHELERVLADSQRILGPSHVTVLAARNNLAATMLDSASADHLDLSVAHHERVVNDTERILGPDHPDTLTSRHNLAYAYESASRVDKAIALHERVTADSERILGPDHPDTLDSRRTLARLLGRV